MFGSGRRLRVAGAVVATATLAASAGAAGPGALDRSFGSNGIVTTDFGPFRDEVTALAIQPDGKILAAGTSDANEGDTFALARYNRDGSLDTSFGAKGKVTTSVGAYDVTGGVVLLQPDGRIVVAGTSYTKVGPDTVSAQAIVVARYLRDGSLDPSFGSQGLIKLEQFRSTSMRRANTAVLQADGKILLAGFGPGHHTFSSGFALLRLESDGSLDPSFGSNGEVVGDFDVAEGVSMVNALAVQSDGQIVAAGTSITRVFRGVVIARYRVDGSLDPGFGSAAGGPPIASGGSAWGVAIQPDGKVVIAGGRTTNAGKEILLLERLLPNGSDDATFEVGNEQAIGPATAVALEPDGKIVVAAPGELIRFTPTGIRDPTFGSNGVTPTTGLTEAHALALQPDQKIVLAGSTIRNGRERNFALARYLGTGKFCRVPRVVGLTRQVAGKRIVAAGCRTGTVTRRSSPKPKGRVLAQSPKPGTDLAAGAPVKIVVSRGRT